MKVISNAEFGGERPLFESHDLRLENVIIRARRDNFPRRVLFRSDRKSVV